MRLSDVKGSGVIINLRYKVCTKFEQYYFHSFARRTSGRHDAPEREPLHERLAFFGLVALVSTALQLRLRTSYSAAATIRRQPQLSRYCMACATFADLPPEMATNVFAFVSALSIFVRCCVAAAVHHLSHSTCEVPQAPLSYCGARIVRVHRFPIIHREVFIH
jgi:hypothetical protein